MGPTRDSRGSPYKSGPPVAICPVPLGRMSRFEEKADFGEIEHVQTMPTDAELGTTAKGLAMERVNDYERSLTYWQGIKRYRMAILLSSFISLGNMLNGLDGTITGNVIAIPAFRTDFGDFIDGQYVVSAGWQSAWNGGTRVACMLAAFGAGSLGDWLGRRWTLAIACVLSTASVFIQYYVADHNYVQVLFGRAISGGAQTIFSCMAAAYAFEVAPLPVRGLTTGGLNIWIVVGQL